MHSFFSTARGSNPGPFDPKSDTVTTTPPPMFLRCNVFACLLLTVDILMTCVFEFFSLQEVRLSKHLCDHFIVDVLHVNSVPCW